MWNIIKRGHPEHMSSNEMNLQSISQLGKIDKRKSTQIHKLFFFRKSPTSLLHEGKNIETLPVSKLPLRTPIFGKHVSG